MSSSVCQFAFPDPSFILRQSRVPSLLDTFGKCGCVYCETQSVVVVLFIFFWFRGFDTFSNSVNEALPVLNIA